VAAEDIDQVGSRGWRSAEAGNICSVTGARPIMKPSAHPFSENLSGMAPRASGGNLELGLGNAGHENSLLIQLAVMADAIAEIQKILAGRQQRLSRVRRRSRRSPGFLH
jgi:hypothetical protein